MRWAGKGWAGKGYGSGFLWAFADTIMLDWPGIALGCAGLDWATQNRLLMWVALDWASWGLGWGGQGWDFPIVLRMPLDGPRGLKRKYDELMMVPTQTHMSHMECLAV